MNNLLFPFRSPITFINADRLELAIAVALVIGWVVNAYKLAALASDAPLGEFIVRGVGLLLLWAGGLVGWL